MNDAVPLLSQMFKHSRRVRVVIIFLVIRCIKISAIVFQHLRKITLQPAIAFKHCLQPDAQFDDDHFPVSLAQFVIEVLFGQFTDQFFLIDFIGQFFYNALSNFV